EDEDFAEIEATELDAPEVEVVTSIPKVAAPKAAAPIQKITTSSIQVSAATAAADPFAEEFDEEEVVIDSFASWDEMFHRDVPRVTNRRDPGFSALVQAAITTEDFNKNAQALATTESPRARMADVDDSDVAMVEPADIDLLTNAGSDWPPLRLAIISDLATAPAELDSTSIGESPFSAAWNVPQSDHHASPTWSRHDTSHEVELADQSPAFDEEPILIVEDDNPTPKAPVRREEYRNLFSRLRSG
ncbi:MAG TPA: hypothetical protein VHU84_10170, partial [Lacipirellulaceae bacterium]|nr:hypothetical protein [Lacipirellulaceae bacterium]